MVNFIPGLPQGIPSSGIGETRRPSTTPVLDESLTPLSSLSTEAQVDHLTQVFRERATVRHQLETLGDDIALVTEDLEKLRDHENPNTADLERNLSTLKVKRKELLVIDKTLKTQLENQEQKLIISINKKVKSNFIEILPIFLSRTSEDISEENLLFLREMLINKLTNLEKYGLEVRRFVEENQMKLIQEFDQKGTIKGSANIKFELKMQGEETHNQGKAPVLISLKNGNGEALKVVFKPRDAKIDRSILELFKELNFQRESEETSLLPHYKIWGLDDIGASVWEYIEGQSLSDTAENTLFKLDEDKRPIAQKNLERLEAICRLAGITDLHMENIILNSEHQWVPIDLEVVRDGSYTGLYERHQRNSDKRISEAELKTIDNFLQKKKNLPVRYLVLSTVDLVQAYSHHQAIDKIVNDIYAQLEKLEDSIVLLDKKELFKIVNNDVKNQDVPFFTLINDCLYYGKESDGKILTKRKES